MSMPVQKPGRSKQDYGTPKLFLAAVKDLLGIEDFDIDLAATAENRVTTRYFAPPGYVPPVCGCLDANCTWAHHDRSMFPVERDALTQLWVRGIGWNWLNPPYANITPWVNWAWMQWQWHQARTAVLIPAGTGTRWWRDWVHRKAHALLFTPRLTFEGTPINPKTGKQDCYPKDCALLLYGQEPGYSLWDWRQGKGGLR